MVDTTERLWRLRKDHTWIDARLRDCGGRVELQFFYDGTLVFARICPSRGDACDEADGQRKVLQRSGWNTHW